MKILRYAGFAPEDSFNPASLPAAAFHVDIASASLDAAGDSHMQYEGGFGRGRRVHRPGFYSPQGNVVYATDIRTILDMLHWSLGGYAFTADGGSGAGHNLHEVWASDERNLPSFTTRLGKDVFEHVFAGCIVNSLQFSVSDQFAELTVDIVSAEDKKETLQALADLQLPEEYPLSFPDVRFFVDDIEKSADVRSLTLNVNNSANAEQGRGLGSRFPNRIPVENREVDLTVEVRYTGTEHLEAMWGGSGGVTDEGTGETPMRIEMAAGDDGRAELQVPRGVYASVQTQPSGRAEIQQSLSIQAFSDEVALEDASNVVTDLYCKVENEQGDRDPA